MLHLSTEAATTIICLYLLKVCWQANPTNFRLMNANCLYFHMLGTAMRSKAKNVERFSVYFAKTNYLVTFQHATGIP